MSLDNLHEAGINDYANSNVSLISNDCLDLVDEKIYRLDDNGNISYYGPVPAGTDYYSTPLFILPLRPENVSASDIYPIRNENGDIVGAFNYATIDPSGITTTRKGWHFQLLSKNTPLISIDGAYAYIKAKE